MIIILTGMKPCNEPQSSEHCNDNFPDKERQTEKEVIRFGMQSIFNAVISIGNEWITSTAVTVISIVVWSWSNNVANVITLSKSPIFVSLA